MTGQCCSVQGVWRPLCAVGKKSGPASRRLARRVSTAAASILPGAVLVLLPKCPLCLAAWLTVVTGVGFSSAGAGWVRGTLVVFWVAAAALAALLIIRRRAFGRAQHRTEMLSSRGAAYPETMRVSLCFNWKR